MNFSTAINAALKLLRANGQAIDDSNDIFIHAIDGKLIVAAPKERSRETIAVVMPFPFKSDRVICGTFSARLRKLFTALQNHAYQVTTALDPKGFHLVIKGVSFRYRIDLKGQAIKITRAIDLTENSKTHVETLDCNAVHCVILDEQLTSEENNMPLTITNNYFEDLAAAIDANLFVRNGRNPNKEVLYAAIEAHNAQFVKAVEVQAVPPIVEAPEVTIEVKAPSAQAVLAIQATEEYDILRSQWNDRKIGKGKQSTQKNFKKEMFETARVLSESLLTNGLKDTVTQFEKSETYVRRSARAYTQIYQKSEVIQNLFDSGKISWSAIHKLAEQNPDKVGIYAIEKQATEIVEGGLLKAG